MTDDWKPGVISNADCLPTYRELLAKILDKGGHMAVYVSSHKESHIKQRFTSYTNAYPPAIRLDRHIYAALWAAHDTVSQGPVTNFDIGIYCSLKRHKPPPLRQFHVVGFVSPTADGGDIIGANWTGSHSKTAQKYMVHVTGSTTPVVRRPPDGEPAVWSVDRNADHDYTPSMPIMHNDMSDTHQLCRRLAKHVQEDLDKLTGHKGMIAWPTRARSWRNRPVVFVYSGPTYVASAEVGDIKSLVQAREYLKSCALNHITFKGAL